MSRKRKPPAPTPTSTPLPTSPDGATSQPTSPIVDAGGHVWVIASPNIILRDGVQAAGGLGTIILWYQQSIYVWDGGEFWWQWNATTLTWANVGATDPRLTPTPQPPAPQPAPFTLTCPAPITVQSETGGSVAVSYVATALGGVQPYTITYSPPSGTLFPIGASQVSVSAQSADGQMGNCAFPVSVVNAVPNTTPPPVVITNPGAHPLFFLDSAKMASLIAKKNANDADYLAVKAGADALVSGNSYPIATVTDVSSTNPCQITIAEGVPWSGTSSVGIYIGGGTVGGWTGINKLTAGFAQDGWFGTRTGSNTFTIPFDATGLPTWSTSGQTLALFAFGLIGGTGDVNGEGWSVFETLGLMHQLTSTGTDTPYSILGKKWLAYARSLGVARIDAFATGDSGFPARTNIRWLAIGFDWFYNVLSPTEISQLVATFNLCWDAHKTYDIEQSGPMVSNYFVGYLLGYGIAGMVTKGDNARSDEITSTMRGYFDVAAAADFAEPIGAFAGGAPLEGYIYGVNAQRNILLYLGCIKTATGEDIIGNTNYAQKFAKNLIYNLKPNRWQVIAEADQPGGFTGVVQRPVPLHFADILDGTSDGEHIQYLYDQMGASTGFPQFSEVDAPGDRFYYAKAGRTSTDYSSALARLIYFYGDQHLIYRAGWGTSDVWMSLRLATRLYTFHQNRLAGHLDLQRGSDYFLVNANQWKGPAGDGSIAGATTFNSVSKYGNTLFHYDGGYTFTGGGYEGGQSWWGNDGDARVGEVNTTAGFGYASAELKSAYYMSSGDQPAPKSPIPGFPITSFIRSAVMAGTGVVIVYDYVQRSSGSYDDRFFWHINQQASVSLAGTTVTAALGSSKMFLKALLPGNGSPTVTLGRDYDSVDDTGTPITYRVAVGDPSPAALLVGLHAFYLGASGLSSMPTTSLITGDTMYGASVVDGSTTWVAMFSKDQTPQTGVTYVA